jgi:glycosyltransferase involved in cell wall biosynthesis
MVQALDAGGSERQVTEIAKSLDRSRFEPHVACFRHGGMRMEELRDAGVPILHLPIASFRSADTLRAVAVLGRYIREKRIRLVHTFDPPANYFGVPAARLLRVPAVLSSQRSFRSLRGPRARHLMRITDRLTDGIVVNCLALRDSLIREDRVSPSRIHVCYNGIDLNRFHSRRPRHEPGSPLIAGYVGVLRREKGLDSLLEAMVRPQCPELRFRISGNGPAAGALKDQCRLLDLDRVCSFHPSTNRVEAVLREMDIFVLPSLSEALSNSLMEAMACGCAVVASKAGGNPELVTHGETGFLFEPGNSVELAAALRSLVLDQSLRERLGRNAAESIRNRFGPPLSARALGRIYDSFLEDGRLDA